MVFIEITEINANKENHQYQLNIGPSLIPRVTWSALEVS